MTPATLAPPAPRVTSGAHSSIHCAACGQGPVHVEDRSTAAEVVRSRTCAGCGFSVTSRAPRGES